MSRRSSLDHSIPASEGDGLAVIREEQASPLPSHINTSRTASACKLKEMEAPVCKGCQNNIVYTPGEVKAMLAEKEAELRAQFDEELKTQIRTTKDRFDFILQNEQLRTSYMLREAHRERREKVEALQAQLECKNMTGLMYVLCSERKKSRFEKLRIIEGAYVAYLEYTKYIHTLHDILTEGQLLILHLSRGYKTAARVDHEWREKMRSIIKEFQEYVYHFAGGTPESNQYVFDVPALLKTEASIVDDPDEDPCTCKDTPVSEEGEMSDSVDDHVLQEKTWWERLDSECRPFVMFGDMADFKPPKRREVVAAAKAAAAKTAPVKWKEYLFNEMSLKLECPNAEALKDEYPKHLPEDKWVCHGYATNGHDGSISTVDNTNSRRGTSTSYDMRSMGSILKVVATSNSHGLPPVKTNLLGARDSMEIASTTKLREKRNGARPSATSKNVFISIARGRSPSRYNSDDTESIIKKEKILDSVDEERSVRRDSQPVISSHKLDADHKINYEKVCPMEQCRRMQVDSFMRTLPSYMRASPFTLFEQNFANYETCSPEQLEILRQRLENKKKVHVMEEDSASLLDFEPVVDGVAVQTSEVLDLPPCTCRDPYPSAAASNIRIFRVEDLIPMKEALDEITRECFYDSRILFDRFKVVGENASVHSCTPKKDHEEFKKQRVQEIKNILQQHPSMLDLFQPNARC